MDKIQVTPTLWSHSDWIREAVLYKEVVKLFLDFRINTVSNTTIEPVYASNSIVPLQSHTSQYQFCAQT